MTTTAAARDSTLGLAAHARRVRAALERHETDSPRWHAARELALAAVDLDPHAALSDSDNVGPPQPDEHC